MLVDLATAFQYLLRNRLWVWLVLALVALGFRSYQVSSWKHKAEQSHSAFVLEKAALNETVANYRAATAKAQADDAQHIVDVRKRDDQILKEQHDAFTSQLADARSRAAAYGRLHPGTAPANPGSIPNPTVSASAASPGIADGPRAYSNVPQSDLDTCATIWARLKDVQTWWSKQVASPR